MKMGLRRQFLVMGAVGLLLIPALGREALADAPVEAALRGFVSAIDASPGWTAAFRRLSYDEPTDTAVLSGLSIATPAGEVKIECVSLSVVGYAGSSDGGFTAKAVKTDGITVDIGSVKTAISDIAFDDLGVPPVPGGSFDPEKPFTSIMSVYSKALKAELGHGHIGSVSVIEVINGITTRISYQDFEIGNLQDGKTASISAGPIRIQSQSPEGPVDVTIARVESTDMDLGAMIRVYDPSAYASDGTGDLVWHNILGHAAYKGVEMQLPEAKVQIAEFSMDAFKARQPKHSFAPLLDKVMAHPELSDQAMADADAREGIVDMMSAFSIGRFGVSGIKVQATGTNQFELADFHISDLSIEGLGEMAIEGMAGNFEGQGSLKIGRVAFGGLKFADPELLRAAIRAAGGNGDGGDGSPTIDPTKLMPKLGFMEAAGIDFEGSAAPHFALEKMRIDLADYIGYIPTKVEESIIGLDLPLAAMDPEPRQIWQSLGYSDNVRLNTGLSAGYEDPTGTVTLRSFTLDVDGVGKLAADAKFSGVPLTKLTNEEEAKKVMATGKLESFHLRFDNSGIVEKVFAMLAEQGGAKPEDIVAQVTQPLLGALAGNQAFQDKVTTAISAFVKNPKSIAISATPGQPVAFPAIIGALAAGPQILPDLIGADVTANQ